MSVSENELLRRYVREGAEGAFSDLVDRFFDLIYSAATRQVGSDTTAAEDVAQIVFSDLARKAESLIEQLGLQQQANARADQLSGQKHLPVKAKS